MMVEGVVVTRLMGMDTEPPLFLVDEDEEELDDDLEDDPEDDDELQLLHEDLYPSVEYDPTLEDVVVLPPWPP